MGRFFPARKWSPVEEDYLKQNFNAIQLTQLGIMLGRTPTSVKAYAKKLGLVPGETVTASPKPSAGPRKARSGRRADLGLAVRSPWEANVLRVLTALGKRWVYEPKTFYFIGEKRGATSYTPDIYLPDDDLYLEVKGHLNSEGRSKVKKFKKYHPEEFAKLRAIPGTNKSQAAKWFASFGVPCFALYNVLRFDYALHLEHWEHDTVSEKWATSNRARKRPDDAPLALAEPTVKIPKQRRKKSQKT